jgi:hypothetical protein
MSNYVQSTNFATKDALTSGDPLKIVKGTEINTEFVNIAVAVATKADLASPTFTGTPLAPTASPATNNTQIATTAYIDAAITAVKAALFPVGSIFTAVVATNPGTLLGFGTWTAFGAGRVPVGFDAGNVLFDTAEETGGAANATLPSHTHTATVTDPGHVHNIRSADGPAGASSGLASYAGSFYTDPRDASNSAVTSITVANSTEGASATNANYQPYITVFMWKRTV